MTYANPTQRLKLIAGFRALADFLESSPAVPAPLSTDVLVFPPASSDSEQRREIDGIAKLIGADIDDQTADYGHYTTSRYFGPVEYRAVAIPARSRQYHESQRSYTPNVIPDRDEEV